MLTIKPDAAIAKFGSVFRGVLFLFHEGHPSRVLPSGKPGALQIVLDRGLDIFQAPVKSGGFSLGDRLQEHRMAKGFYVTYLHCIQ
ncbi:MIT C-terminal domain-containing protein, partial [uncultured Marivita sp.]|uniref:MIT C-terminal domain-containing protein n=1 Tax=uncultured Marivita sp. TaxID=888080 RepID=UPI0025F80BB6